MPASPPVVDELGLVPDNGILVIEIPSLEGFLPIRVKYRINRGYERFEYGPLPVSYTGYEDGVIPAGTTTDSITFSYSELPPELQGDMFYYVEGERLIHARIIVKPLLLRILTEVPKGTRPYSLYGKVTQGVDKDFGWFRGEKEMVFLPKIHVGWVFRNPTNMDLRTDVTIIYGEYRYELIRDVDAIYGIITGKLPHHRVVYGSEYYITGIEDSLRLMGIYDAKVIPALPSYAKKDEVAKVVNEIVNNYWR